jgi:DNA replication protein DnaC
MFESDAFKVSQEIIDTLRKKYCDNCSICKGRRILETAQGPIKCECVKQFNQEYGLIQANLPKKFHALTKHDLDPEFIAQNTENMALVAQYNDKLDEMLKLGKGLFLQGENGAGKSFIATLILRKALELGYTGYFILQRDLVDIAFAALFDNDIQKDLETIICQIDFLIIDEIDKIFIDNGEKVQNLLEGLLKKRSYVGKPLIVTSNKVMSQLGATLGKTIVSAFEEDLIEITFVGNYRPKLSQRNKDLLNGDE